MSPSVLTLPEAAERLGVHYMTAYRYVRTGRLPAERDGAEWRVRTADVDRLRTERAERETRAARTEDAPRGTASRRSRGAAATRLERALVAGDEAGAWSVVESALVSGATPAEVHLDILSPAMTSIGRRWQSGELSVADEHRASGVAQRIVARLGPRFARRGRTRGTVVVGAVTGEHHAIPGAILADLLRGRGYSVVDLGPDTPPESFVDAAQDASRLVAVVLGTIASGRDRALRRTIRHLRESGITAPVLVGGPGVSDEARARALGADGWTGRDGDAACTAVDAVAGRARVSDPGRR